MDFSEYADPAFDPKSLRVVDLRRVLNQNGVVWSSRHRKPELVDLFTKELVPKLKKQIREKQAAEEKKKQQQQKEKEIVLQDVKVKEEDASTDAITPNPLSNLIIQKRQPTETPLTKKRKRVESTKSSKINTEVQDHYSKTLQRKIKKKRVFSEIEKPSKKKQKKDKMDTKNIFNRNTEIKFDLPNTNGDKVNQIANSTFNNLDNIEDSTNNGSVIIEQPAKPEVFTPINIKHEEVTPIPYINTTHENTEITPQIDTDREDTSVILNGGGYTQPCLSTPLRVEFQNNLTGPTNDIRMNKADDDTTQIRIKKELERNVKVKLERLHSLRSEIDDDLKQLEQSSDIYQNKVETELPVPSFASSNNITLDNDSAQLTHLQSLFDIETSKIEIESEKVLNMINSKEKFKYYKGQFIRILVVWILLLAFSFILAIYRQERIQVGFCGYEIRNKGSFLNKLFNLNLNCVQCPDHAVCYSNSELRCASDYIVKSPLFWSVWGLLPTYNQCVLDSAKVKKINKMVKTTLDILAKRNAEIKCGDGLDSEVGLSWKQIVEIVDQKVMSDVNDENYYHIWDKVKIVLTTRTDLKFLWLDEKHEDAVRSLSLSKLSIKCRCKRLIIMILVKYKFYFICLSFILLTLSYIFYQINLLQSKNRYYRDTVKEVFSKLQKQASDYRRTRLGKPYIAKIQLRDYYVPQLLKLSRKNRDAVWTRVASTVEANSNVRTDDVEVNGDIMRVWSWYSDI